MNPTVKVLWIETLEADPLQLTGYLGNVEGARCCLGVLCDLAVAAGVIPEPVESHSQLDAILRYGSGEGNYHVLPPEVVEWAGLETNNPTIRSRGRDQYGDPINSLSSANDTGTTMREIAQIVREEL